MRRLDGQVCLVTGGTRGLGLAFAQAFAREGAHVAVTWCHSESDAEDARSSLAALGAEPLLVRGDVCDAKHAQATVEAVVSRWGRVDVLVNNAGVTQMLPLALIEEKDWDLVMDVNVKGAFLFSRAVARPMIKAKRGHILMVGAFSSERVIDAPVHFAASKSALRGLAEALARELGRYDIKVNLVAPGLLDVGLSRALPKHRVDEYLAQCPLGRLGTAEEVAKMATWLVSADNSFMTGAKLTLDGGL